ncbi:hypothetical protein BC936DRAFT_143634 [Jimgerdemannia flammicorona]|uniref:Uncharacterized protein n=1 Tax=Jimgerdemannia flammicorona TaxID=994334 RepID=A0A432ZYP6_9FUNG|nr:hypothetical protein BC936DRAFT_143634 [Jimgerdemannia flammicorona]
MSYSTHLHRLLSPSYGEPISIEAYVDDFLKDEKVTAKRLTADIEKAIQKLSVNAPDWCVESLRAAHMARKLLFTRSAESMGEYVSVTQSLVNFFVNLGPTHPEVKLLQSDLLNYRDHLYSLRLSDSDIANYDGRSLSPTTATIQLLQQTARSLIDVPLFLPGLIAHLPIYVLGKIAAHYEIYEEVRAQNKIFAGLLFVPLTYVALFFYIWYAWFATSLFGLAFSAFTVVILAWYHTSLIDDRYENWKDLVGRWRLFDAVVLGRGMWGRKKRVEETKRAREKCLRSVRTTVKKFKNQEADIMVVWEALKKRVATGEERKMERKGLEWVRDN